MTMVFRIVYVVMVLLWIAIAVLWIRDAFTRHVDQGGLDYALWLSVPSAYFVAVQIWLRTRKRKRPRRPRMTLD